MRLLASLSLLGTAQAGSGFLTMVASMTKYPEYTGNLMVGGTVTVETPNELSPSANSTMTLALTGLEADAMGGVHIHAGMTCETSGPHYWTPASDNDPWNVIQWSTSGSDAASDVIEFQNGYGYDNQFHAVVVHDSFGNRVACGVLDRTPCEAFCAYVTDACSSSPSWTYDAECETSCALFVRSPTHTSTEKNFSPCTLPHRILFDFLSFFISW